MRLPGHRLILIAALMVGWWTPVGAGHTVDFLFTARTPSDVIYSTDYDIVILQIVEACPPGTNGKPPEPMAEILVVLRGSVTRGRHRVSWDQEDPWGWCWSEVTKEAMASWEGQPITAPRLGSTWIVAGELSKDSSRFWTFSPGRWPYTSARHEWANATVHAAAPSYERMHATLLARDKAEREREAREARLGSLGAELVASWLRGSPDRPALADRLAMADLVVVGRYGNRNSENRHVFYIHRVLKGTAPMAERPFPLVVLKAPDPLEGAAISRRLELRSFEFVLFLDEAPYDSQIGLPSYTLSGEMEGLIYCSRAVEDALAELPTR